MIFQQSAVYSSDSIVSSSVTDRVPPTDSCQQQRCSNIILKWNGMPKSCENIFKAIFRCNILEKQVGRTYIWMSLDWEWLIQKVLKKRKTCQIVTFCSDCDVKTKKGFSESTFPSMLKKAMNQNVQIFIEIEDSGLPSDMSSLVDPDSSQNTNQTAWRDFVLYQLCDIQSIGLEVDWKSFEERYLQ